jgi:D-3-phosphoglycerate dehydrogenase
MAFGFMLGLSRNLFHSSLKLSSGIWEKNGGFELSGKTVGIIGVGFIGKEVIRLLKPFNCNILCNDIIEQEAYYKIAGVKSATKEEIYKAADIITLHTPFDDSTENLINIEVMKECKKIPYLINTARGGIISEHDLLLALKNGYISGAAIDTYVYEPLDNEEIYKNDKIVCTPHIGGNSKEAVLAMGRSAINNLQIP